MRRIDAIEEATGISLQELRTRHGGQRSFIDSPRVRFNSVSGNTHRRWEERVQSEVYQLTQNIIVKLVKSWLSFKYRMNVCHRFCSAH